jgi:GNAT superfamily N-acetyltransferase
MNAGGWLMSKTKAEVVALAGFRLLECLATGKTLYVDDLVTREDRRSKGHGEILMRWLEDRARTAGCQTFSLDSGTQRTGAHRFYFRMGMVIPSSISPRSSEFPPICGPIHRNRHLSRALEARFRHIPCAFPVQ